MMIAPHSACRYAVYRSSNGDFVVGAVHALEREAHGYVTVILSPVVGNRYTAPTSINAASVYALTPKRADAESWRRDLEAERHA